MAEIKHTTDASFEADVANSPRPVIVDFWAPWCGPCKSLGPVLEKLETDYGGRFKLVKIDSDQEQQLGAAFGIRSIPTIMYFQGGAKKDQSIGVCSKSEILSKLAAL